MRNMWVDRRNAIKDLEEFEDCSLDEIAEFCKTAKIDVSADDIRTKLLLEAKEDGVNLILNKQSNAMATFPNTNDKLIRRITKELSNGYDREEYILCDMDYTLRVRKFEIYKDKCSKLLNILNMILGNIELDTRVMAELDITIKGSMIKQIDVMRIVIPLIENYELAQEAKRIAENPLVYMHKIPKSYYNHFLPFKSILEPLALISIEHTSPEFVPMTDRQKHIKTEEHRHILRKTFGKNK